MERGELGRAERGFGRHEIFSEKIGVLDHGAFERLENHATPLEILRNDVALDQLIVRKNHSSGELIEADRILQNIFPIAFRKRPRNLEYFEIEKIDIRKAPRLIFARRSWDRFKL